jgi:NAD(P)H-dependent flavin oxidoreductase YrpB (nitropropane dioxygenase family)
VVRWPVALSGAMANRCAIRGIRLLGADFAYIDTAVIATDEANAPLEYNEHVGHHRSSDPINLGRATSTNRIRSSSTMSASRLPSASAPRTRGRPSPNICANITGRRQLRRGVIDEVKSLARAYDGDGSEMLCQDPFFRGLDVSSQTLMAHSYRVIPRMRYGTDSTWERHNDRGGPSSDTT